MKVGIRFCGGCNPHYDRAAMVNRVCGKHPEWTAEIAREGAEYDVLLVVGGCGSCCASYRQFVAERVVKVWDDEEDIAL